MCTEMKDDTSIYDNESKKAITWKDYKEQHKNWDFGGSDPDRHDFEAKAQLAWKRVALGFANALGRNSQNMESKVL